MAQLEDLIQNISDPKLRQQISVAVADLKRRQNFGLKYEDHIPETTALAGLPVEAGAQVLRSDDPGSTCLYTVLSLTPDGQAVVKAHDNGEAVTLPVTSLLVVKRFGEPIYPSLTPLGSVQRGPADKPYHTVINAENYHALQLLLYLYEGQVDCLYLDPPYNTGARDWKYNNRYVDSNDDWRHSKWLSYMEKRLTLAKRLLKPDGVAIITIDEHEVHHLGMLLERVFSDAYRQVVSIIINPKGVTQERFSRVDEYAFFCFFGDSKVTGRGDDYLSPASDEDVGDVNIEHNQRPRWKGLLRSGTNSKREDRKNMFYPVLIDPVRGAVMGAGEVLPYNQAPDFVTHINGHVPVWPVRTDGTFGNWGVGNIKLRQLISKGYVSLGGHDVKRNSWAFSYLSKELEEQVEAGVLEVVFYDEKRNVVDVRFSDVAKRRIKTVWRRSRHDAGVGGTDVLTALLGERTFPFPKSVYAVFDSLMATLRDKKDALIVDVFAGSGTTFHATCLLNAEDGDEGRRQCVLVTNNEVQDKDAKQLYKDGLLPGSLEFEKYGVFEVATRPRCEAVVTGQRPDGSTIPGTHINGRPYSEGFPENVEFFKLNYLDPDAVSLGQEFAAILPALWLTAGGVGTVEAPPEGADFLLPDGCPFAVLFKESRFRQFQKALAARTDVTHIWLVTDSEEAFAEMRAQFPPRLTVAMLYRDYLRNFQINTDRSL